MTEMVPIIPLPPAPPALNFGGNNFDCWVMVGGFNLSTANVATAMLGLPKFADALDAQFKPKFYKKSFYKKSYFSLVS